MRTSAYPAFLILAAAAATVCAQAPAAAAKATASPASTPLAITLANERVRATLTLVDGHLRGEKLETLPEWSKGQGPGGALETSGGFLLEMVWSDWRPPGRANNADNEITLRADDFTLVHQAVQDDHGDQVASLTFDGPDKLGLELIYRLPAGAHYLRRQLRVFDPQARGHFLHYLWSLDAEVMGKVVGKGSPAVVVKAGGFGQPIALLPNGPAGAAPLSPSSGLRLTTKR